MTKYIKQQTKNKDKHWITGSYHGTMPYNILHYLYLTWLNIKPTHRQYWDLICLSGMTIVFNLYCSVICAFSLLWLKMMFLHTTSFVLNPVVLLFETINWSTWSYCLITMVIIYILRRQKIYQAMCQCKCISMFVSDTANV